jgi:hypothetical protein
MNSPEMSSKMDWASCVAWACVVAPGSETRYLPVPRVWAIADPVRDSPMLGFWVAVDA